MNILILLLLIFIPSLCPEVSKGNTLSSNKACYQGNSLLLEGKFYMQHPLGELRAEKATLQKNETDAEFPFSHIHLEKDVHFLLQTTDHLSCHFADINLISGKASLYASAESPVLYEGQTEDSAGNKQPFSFSSQKIHCTFHPLLTDYSLDYLVAQEKVLLRYAEDFTLQAEEASYDKQKALLSAKALSQNNPCILIYQGEAVFSSLVTVYIEQKLLHLYEPSGTLASHLISSRQEEKVLFSCKELFWNHLLHQLVLQGNVSIQESRLGTLSTQKELVLQQNDSFIQLLHIEGDSLLQNGELSLHAPVSLHIEKGIGTASGTSTNPVLYTDGKISLSAETAFVTYEESSFTPTSLSLEGKVLMQDRSLQTRCGLADKAIYSPDHKTLILTAAPGKKVLFWDQEQEVSLCADEVHVTQDPQSGKTSFKSIGKATFSFSREEALSLKQLFPFISLQEDAP